MLSDAVQVALIVSVAPTIASIGALIVSVLNHKKIEAVHVATNSMKDALVKATREEALMEGHAAGVVEQKGKQKVREITLEEGRVIGADEVNRNRKETL